MFIWSYNYSENVTFIVDENTISPQAHATQHNDYEYIEKAMVILDKREMDILSKRYGLGDGDNLSLSQVAKKYGLTRERIRQIEAKALRKLRHPTRSSHLKGFLAE